MVDVASGVEVRVAAARPSSVALVWAQARYALRLFWRRPVAAVFTVIFPLSLLVVVSAVYGNEILDSRGGIRVAQFTTPVFAVFGICMAAFSILPTSVATARESGVLQRLRGTPLQPWMQLTGRALATVVESMVALLLMLGIGVAAYDVQIVWAKIPALLVTMVVGIAAFAALGLAVAALVHSSTAVRATTMASLMLLSFVSDIFAFGTLTPALDKVGWFFPVRHFANAAADDVNPRLAGAGFDWNHLAVLVIWGAVGALVAVRFFSWDRVGRRPGGAAAPAPDAVRPGDGHPSTGSGAAALTVRETGRPGAARLVLDQVRAANLQIRRDRVGLFFATAFPALLLVFFTQMNPGARWRGVPVATCLTPAFAVYGIAVTAVVTLPEAVCAARQNGSLKRLRGTPVPSWAYIAGRIGSAYVIAGLTLLLMYAVGIAFLDVRLNLVQMLWLLLATATGTACFTVLGLVLAFAARSSGTAAAVGLGTCR